MGAWYFGVCVDRFALAAKEHSHGKAIWCITFLQHNLQDRSDLTIRGDKSLCHWYRPSVLVVSDLQFRVAYYGYFANYTRIRWHTHRGWSSIRFDLRRKSINRPTDSD